MNEHCGPFSTASRPRGVTLIEILAGLVILGTLLVSVSIARARFMRQQAEADRELAAVRAADKLMTRWMSGSPQNIPLSGAGPLDGAQNFSWRTRTVRDPAAGNLGALHVQLQIIDLAAPPVKREPIIVEFLVHDFRPKVNEQTAKR